MMGMKAPDHPTSEYIGQTTKRRATKQFLLFFIEWIGIIHTDVATLQ